jgi:hypothetical protein
MLLEVVLHSHNGEFEWPLTLKRRELHQGNFFITDDAAANDPNNKYI